MTNPNTPDDPTTHMPLIEHLIELRTRLIRSLAAFVVLFCSLVYFANDIYEIVSKPIRDQLPEGTTMIATDITATFFAPFKLTMVVALFLAMPVILHQVWKFVSPGLYAHEKKVAIPMLAASILLFYTGIAFAHFLIFPVIMNFFALSGPESVVVTPDISQYLSIALKLFLAFGLAFEIPIFTMLIIWSGMFTVKELADKRRYVIVFCFVVGMFLTPPDPFSQTMLAVPMCLLFELGLLFGRMVDKKAEPVADEKEAAGS